MSASKPLTIVAVVEDDPPSRTAPSAEAYLEASTTPTCVIVDVHLPGMSGIELRRRHEEVIRDRAQQNGCAAFFWKPVDGHTLTATIAALAHR